MNSVLDLLGKEMLPKIGNVCDYSRTQINDKALAMIDEFISDSIKSTISMEYLGIRRLTPKETYETQLSAMNNMNIDISQSSFYKTEAKFKMKNSNDVITRRISLPYLDRYGRLIASGIPYNIKPILTDSVISPHASGMFVKLHITKTNISSKSYILTIDDSRESLSVIYADLNRKVIGDSSSPLNKAITPIAFYVLSTYGLSGVIKMITGAGIKAVNVKEYEHNPANGIYYRDLDNPDCVLGFVVNLKERLDVIDNILVSIFYILKHTHVSKSKELYDYIINGNVDEEKSFWIFQFGRFFYKGSLTFDKSTKEILNHLETVKNYLDSFSRKDLASIGIEVNDYIELNLAILDRFNMTILTHKDINADIRQYKNLNVLYYVLNPLLMGINTGFREMAKREKARKAPLSTKEAERLLVDNITERAIQKIVKSTKKNLSVQLASGCTDNLLNYQLITDEQNRGDGVHVNSNNSFPTSLRNIVPLHYIVGCMHHLSKKAATPLLHASPLISVHNNKFVIPQELIDEAAECYKRGRRATVYTNHKIDDIDDESELEV